MPRRPQLPSDQTLEEDRNPPALNVPGAIAWFILLLVAVHLVRTVLLDPDQDIWVILNFSFIPGCYAQASDVCAVREAGALIWSPLSYSFLHGGWAHLVANSVWLLAFGTPVARRLGPLRFVIFSAVGAIAGAAVFAAINPTLIEPVIGASGVVSALMGAACRFAFTSLRRVGDPHMADGPLLSVRRALSDRTVLFFIIVFFGINLVIGSGMAGDFGAGGPVAWEAHLGGFLFGFLCFRPFDRRLPPARDAHPDRLEV